MGQENLKDLVIIGAGGFGRETAAQVEEINAVSPTWNFIGFIDDNVTGSTFEGYPVLGGLEHLKNMNPKPYATIAIGNPQVRKRIASSCEDAGVPFAALIHPSALIRGSNTPIGDGTIVAMGVAVGINAKIGKHCILDGLCTVGHDTVVEDFVNVGGQNAFGGESHIGSGCFFGLGCTVINQIDIAENCTFGAGSVVVKDVTVPGTYVGVPAKLIKPLQE